MALQLERAGLIADGVIRARDWDPETFTLTGASRQLFTQAACDALRKAWGRQKWPQLMRVEARRFRPDWDTAEAYTTGQEVWHEGTEAYWRALQDHSGQEPAEGSAYWEEPEDFIPFIQLDQPWEDFRIDDAGADLNAFAWELDPRLNPGLAPIKGCTWWMDSIVLPQDAPAEVWIRFMPPCPRLSFVEWSASTAYTTGELCYRTTVGRCYIAQGSTTGDTPEGSPSDWAEVQVPEFMSAYVRQFMLSQWLTVAEGRYEAEGRAEKMLQEMEAQMLERSGGDGLGARVSVGARRL
jgi:hypothetical protein